MAYIFVDGVPDRIKRDYFRSKHGQAFPDLLPETQNNYLDSLINDIYTMFYGVNWLWKGHPAQVWYDKARMCYGLLLAWYIVDVDPSMAAGVPSMGGMPIKSKQIGGVKIVFGLPDSSSAPKGYMDVLAPLRSNPFGNKAYQMIKSAIPNATIFSGRRAT